MSIQRMFSFLLLFPAALACAGGNALFRVEQSCVKVPTPEARADCERRQKEAMAAFEKEKKVKQKAAEAGGQKKNELCFTRKTSGEVVCPN